MAREKAKAAQNGGKKPDKQAKKKETTAKAKKPAPNNGSPPTTRTKAAAKQAQEAATPATPSPQDSPQDKDAQILKLQQQIALLSGSNPVTLNLPPSDQKPAAKPKKSTTGSKKITTSSKKSAKKAKKLAKKMKKSIAKSEPKDVLVCKVPRTKDIEKLVHGWVSDIGFRKVKFIQNDAELEKFTLQCYDGLVKLGHLNPEYFPNRESFVASYKDYVNKELNEKRSYVQSETKGDCFKRLTAHFLPQMKDIVLPVEQFVDKEDGKTHDIPKVPENVLPTVEEILRCAKRDIYVFKTKDPGKDDATAGQEDATSSPKVADKPELDDEETKRMFGIFEFYVNELLYRVIGNKQFGPKVRHFYTVSSAKTTESGKEVDLVTPSTEAFAVLNYANCIDKWMNTFAYELDYAKKNGTPLVDPKKKPVPPKLEPYNAKWSQSDGGQKKIDGWSLDGRRKFLAYMKEIKEAHGKGDGDKKGNQALRNKVHFVESEFLKGFREQNDITGATYEEYMKIKRRKKRPNIMDVDETLEEVEEDLNCWEDSDDDDSDEDEMDSEEEEEEEEMEEEEGEMDDDSGSDDEDDEDEDSDDSDEDN